MRRKLIELLGGYATINDAIDAVRDKDFAEKKRILTLAVKHLFNTIGADDILKEKDGQWMFCGKIITAQEKKAILAEAEQFRISTLWKVLQKDIEWQANRKMFILSQSDADITAGKLWLYTLDAIRTRLESMKKESGKFNNNI